MIEVLLFGFFFLGDEAPYPIISTINIVKIIGMSFFFFFCILILCLAK